MKLNDLVGVLCTGNITIHDEATKETKDYDTNGFGNGNTIKRVCHVYGNRTVTLIWPLGQASCYISIA